MTTTTKRQYELLSNDRPVLREPLVIGLAQRADARQVCADVLAGAAPTARTLVVDVDGDIGRCVYAVGAAPVAFWELDAVALWKDAEAVVRGGRFHALRGSVDELVTVRRREPRGPRLSSALAARLRDTLARELAIPGARVAVAPAERPPMETGAVPQAPMEMETPRVCFAGR